MLKRIVFHIEEGSFDRGFPVTIRIWDTRQHFREIQGKLPPVPHLPTYYKQWQDIYQRLGVIQRITIPQSQITNVSTIEECRTAAGILETALNEWLNQPSVRRLGWQLLQAIGQSDPIQFILQTRNPELRRLPWHLWDFFQVCYPQAEITLCAETEPCFRRFTSPVSILAIVGSKANDEPANFEADLAVLKQLPGAQVEQLDNDQLQALYDRLWDKTKSWDILFFSGHSFSHAEDNGGAIVFAQEKVSLQRLHNALEYAVKKGLKLVIFNSCDGLGLARYLSDLKIPYMIVMREPVPDVVAQRFARYFLETFAHGESVYGAVQNARKRLQEEMEQDYPCASWLPIIFQNPLALELKYPRPVDRRTPILWLAGTAIATLIGWGLVDHIQFRQRLSQGENILVQTVTTPAKVAGVRAFGWQDYGQAVRQFERSLQQVRNDPETMIYLNNARAGDRPSVKLAVAVPISSNVNVAQEMLRGVAQAQDEINRQGGIRGKPLTVMLADDANHPQRARRMATTFVNDPQILAVIGHNASDASVAAAPLYNQGQLVMVTPTSFSDKLSSSGKYIFRMVPSIWFVADKLADYISQTVPHPRVAICSDAAAVDNESFRNQFTNTLLKKGGTFVNVSCDLSDPKFEPQTAIAQVRHSGANALLLAPHVDRIHKAVAVAQANQGQLPLYGSPTLDTAETLSGKAAVRGLIASVPWHPAVVNHPFPQQATRLWGGAVNWRTAMAYDATWAIAASLQQQQTREGIRDVIGGPAFTVEGASGTVRFLPSGERQIVPGVGVLVRVQPASATPLGYDFVPFDSPATSSDQRKDSRLDAIAPVAQH